MQPLRAVVYCRISSDPKGRALGVARQEEDCRSLAALRGWDVTSVLVDNDVSAYKQRRRPGYEAMLKMVEAGEVDVVVAYSVDRLTRRVAGLARLIDVTNEAGVLVATVSGDLDTGSATGRMVANIIGAVSQAEVERLKERVVRKQDELAGKGLPSNRTRWRPFGYTADGMSVVDAERDVVAEAAGRVLAGEALSSVARDLQARGVATSTGAPWHVTSLRTTLVGPRAAGLRVHRGEVVGEAAWPPLLDRDTWEAVRSVLLARGGRRAPGANARRHLLSGWAVCGTCGRGLGVAHHTARDGKPLLRYACKDRHAGRVLAHLDAFVVGAVLERLSDPRVAVALSRRAERPEAAAALDALRARRESVVAEFAASDVMSPGELRTVLSGLDERIQAAEAQVAAWHSRDVLAGVEGMTRQRWDALPLSRRRALLAALFAPLVVHPSRRRGGRGFDAEGVVLLAREL